MSDNAADLAALRKIHEDCTLLREGGVPVALLRSFGFRAGNDDQRMDLLLFPSQHSGYVTRLFFEKALEGRGRSQNWHQHRVIDRNWWAPSWQNVPVSLPWPAMLCAHLEAVA